MIKYCINIYKDIKYFQLINTEREGRTHRLIFRPSIVECVKTKEDICLGTIMSDVPFKINDTFSINNIEYKVLKISERKLFLVNSKLEEYFVVRVGKLVGENVIEILLDEPIMTDFTKNLFEQCTKLQNEFDSYKL